jgi:hypothetical protein
MFFSSISEIKILISSLLMSISPLIALLHAFCISLSLNIDKLSTVRFDEISESKVDKNSAIFISPQIDGTPFNEKVLLLTKQSSQYDKIILGQLIPKTHLLSIPILWWNINDDICKDIYFSKVDIATLFNPAKLLKYYIDDGFSVSAPGGLKTFNISKEIKGYRIMVHHFESICYLITNSLMKTSDVYAFSCKVTDAIASGEIAPNTKIDMVIHLDSFGNPKINSNIEN